MMSNVTLKIGGRQYAVACADGEEEHISELGQLIDDKIASMGPASAQNESRALLFAALLMADELHEARNNRAKAAATAPSSSGPSLAELVPALEQIAQRIENLATRVENT